MAIQLQKLLNIRALNHRNLKKVHPTHTNHWFLKGTAKVVQMEPFLLFIQN